MVNAGRHRSDGTRLCGERDLHRSDSQSVPVPCELKWQRCGQGCPSALVGPLLLPPRRSAPSVTHHGVLSSGSSARVLGDAGLTHLTKTSDSAPSPICGVCWERGGWLLFWDTIRDTLKSLVGALVDVMSLLKSAQQQQGSFSGGLLRTKSKILTLGLHLGHCVCLRLHLTPVRTP